MNRKHWTNLRVCGQDEDMPIEQAIQNRLINSGNVHFRGAAYPRETTGIYMYDPDAGFVCHTPRWRAAFGLDTDHPHGPTCRAWHPTRYNWAGFKHALKHAAAEADR